jgi:hypothetical protein
VALWPRRLPRWYWRYQILRDAGKKPPWPAPIPNPVPVWAKARYNLHRFGTVKPKPVYGGVFTGDGVFLRGPGGESEDVAAMTSSGFVWVAGNIGDHAPQRWDKIRLRCTQYGVSFMPWLRCWNPGMTAEQAADRTRLLVRTAQQWGSRALILNIENEAYQPESNPVFPPERAGQILREELWRGETAVSTVGFPPTWPKWSAAAPVGLMQAFMNERTDLLPAVCVRRGIECGFQAAYPTFGTYPAKHPWTAAGYQALWNGPYSVYIGDQIGSNHAWKEWA